MSSKCAKEIRSCESGSVIAVQHVRPCAQEVFGWRKRCGHDWSSALHPLDCPKSGYRSFGLFRNRVYRQRYFPRCAPIWHPDIRERCQVAKNKQQNKLALKQGLPSG
ncbi:unnamed protein product [Scytosiphon promiscuus]